MSKQKTLYTCTNCDAQFPKWSGRCLECGKWSTLEQSTVTKVNKHAPQLSEKSKVTVLNQDKIDEQNLQRLNTNISELDRVLGGGIVPGSLILLGGEPGIGKSTLVLQIAHECKNTLYISGEESEVQVHMRLKRLALEQTPISFLSTSSLEQIIDQTKKIEPELLIIDSIQTIASGELEQAPGTVSQIRSSTTKLLELAKSKQIPIIIIGHITKDGMIAGPKTLEHMVDTVLYLEGDQNNYFRILRGVKNRFGSTNEIGVFEMKEQGLLGIKNPSALFLEGVDQSIPGSVVTVINEGQRCFLVEIQSLVNRCNIGIPQRKASGFDNNRLQMLLAVLSKRLHLPFNEYDVFLNIIGGLKVKEVAIDLAVCMSLISAIKDKVLDKNIVAVGEVGLGGEIRPVPFLEKRIEEAARLGFKKIYIPDQNKIKKHKLIELVPIKNIQDLIGKKK